MRGLDIKSLLDSTGRSQSALARHLDKSPHAISRLVRSPKELPPSEAAQIEAFFGAPAEQPATVTVPVYGFAAAGRPDHVAFASSDVLDEIEMPAGLWRGPVFGVRISGDSMEPRLFSGETVIAARNLPPARNGDCIVELSDGTALVKQYRGARDGRVWLAQYNPAQDFSLDGSAVRAIHAVIMRR